MLHACASRVAVIENALGKLATRCNSIEGAATMESSKSATKLRSQKAVSQSYFGSSEKAQVRKRLQHVFGLIGRGEIPSKGVIGKTEPSYWMISAFPQDPVESAADWSALADNELKRQMDVWLQRGGRTEGLRFAPTETNDPPEEWVAMWLVDAKSGNWCLGISFPANRNSRVDLTRRFQVIEPDMAHDALVLLNHLNRRGASGIDIDQFERLLRWAPYLVILPPMSSKW